MHNSSKGAAKLASTIQKRMNSVANRNAQKNLYVENGTIMAGNKLRLDSMPEVAISPNEYFVCESLVSAEYSSLEYQADSISCTINYPMSSQNAQISYSGGDLGECIVKRKDPLKKGDRVLVAWTHTGEPVVIDRIIRANKV